MCLNREDKRVLLTVVLVQCSDSGVRCPDQSRLPLSLRSSEASKKINAHGSENENEIVLHESAGSHV